MSHVVGNRVKEPSNKNWRIPGNPRGCLSLSVLPTLVPWGWIGRNTHVAAPSDVFHSADG